jgi:hypothetical protein
MGKTARCLRQFRKIGITWEPAALGAAMLLMAVSSTAAGQVPASFLGTWKVTWEGRGAMRQATLTITSSGGTWLPIGVHTGSHNVCPRFERPIEVEPLSENGVIVHLRGSQTLHGCEDSRVGMRLLDENNGKGRLGKAELTFVRQ